MSVKLKELVARQAAEIASLRNELATKHTQEIGVLTAQQLKAVKVWTEDYTHTTTYGKKGEYTRVYSSLSPERGKDAPAKRDMANTMKAHGGRFFFPTEKNGGVAFWSIPRANREAVIKTLSDRYTLTESTKK